MKALILAAGRGSRLQPLTDETPKPLLPVGGFRLCDWQFAACQKAGIREIVMNTAHLAESFESIPQTYAKLGFQVSISREGNVASDALESLGGIVKALPILTDGTEPFLVLAGDVVHDFDLKRLLAKSDLLRGNRLDAHLVAVKNPDFHKSGDLRVADDGTVHPGAGPHTYGCLMIVNPRIFKGLPVQRAKLFPWLWEKRLTAEVHDGFWGNIGTVGEYEALKKNLKAMDWISFEGTEND